MVFAIGFTFVLAHLLYVALAIALKWLVLGRSVVGTYHVHSLYGLRYSIVRICLEAPLAKSFLALFAGEL